MDNAGNLPGKLRTSLHPKLSFGELGGERSRFHFARATPF